MAEQTGPRIGNEAFEGRFDNHQIEEGKRCTSVEDLGLQPMDHREKGIHCKTAKASSACDKPATARSYWPLARYHASCPNVALTIFAATTPNQRSVKTIERAAGP